jgi:photosystem II stability/assembly factor-like uncharacterized protein
MRRVLLILAIVFLSFSAISQSQDLKWKRILAQPCYDVWVNPQNPNTIIVGGEGRRIWRSYDGGNTWDSLVVGYLGVRNRLNNIHINSVDTNVVIIGGLLFGDVRRSTDQGDTWDIVLSRTRAIALNGKALMVREDDPNTYYIGDYTTGTIFKSTDQGITWDSISTVTLDVWVKRNDEYIDTTMAVGIGCIGIRQDSSDVLFCGDVDGNMFISQDGGYTWTFTDSLLQNGQRPLFYRNGVGDQEITRIVFSDRDPRVGYAVITYLFPTNLPNGGLWKTTDGGYNWDLLAFPDTSMWACAARRYKDTDEIFIGGYTEHYYPKEEDIVPGVGIVRGSTDGGLTWTSYDKQIDWVVEVPWLGGQFWDIAAATIDYQIAVGNWHATYESFNYGYGWSARYVDLKEGNIYSVDYPTDSTGYLCGERGLIMKTTNKGTSWFTLRENKTNDLHSIDFVTDRIGYTVGDNGMILKTTNGGENWDLVDTGVFQNLRSVQFLNETVGFVAGYKGTIFRTTNGGNTWQQIKTSDDAHLESIFMTSANTGHAVGLEGVYYSIENVNQIISNDETISPRKITDRDSLNVVYFRDDTTGFAGGSKGLILKTTDAGKTWYETETNIGKTIQGMVFITDSIGIAVGELMHIIHTEDVGETWTVVLNGRGPRANVWSQRYFGGPDDIKLYMASEAGCFMLDVEEPSDIIDMKGDSYFNVYFTGDNDMNFLFVGGDDLSDKLLTISDLQGRVIFRKTYRQSQNGTIEDMINIAEWANGVYFCRMLDGDNINIVKIIKE